MKYQSIMLPCKGLDRDFHYRSPVRRIRYSSPPPNATVSWVCSARCSRRLGRLHSGLSRGPQRAQPPLFRRVFSDTFAAVLPFLLTEIGSGRRRVYPAGKGSNSIRRTMAPKSRRVRWLSILQCSSNSSQSRFQIRQLAEDRSAVLPVHHGSQEVALTHELLIAMDEGLECRRQD